MFPPKFDYHRATSVDDAIDLLTEHADRARDVRVLAGGHGLLPEMKNERENPDVLVDIGEVDDLRFVDADGDETVVGALATYADAATSEPVWTRATALAEAAASVGDVQIRNRGTVGGNLAQADPTEDLPAAVLAADATIVVRGPAGDRTVDAADFFRGDGATVVSDRELVTEIRVPHVEGAGGAYEKKTHPASGYAMVGVAAVVEVENGTVTTARIAVNGVTDPPSRLAPAEDALVGESATDETIAAAADRAGDDLDPDELISDTHASGEFRAQLLGTYVRQAVEAAVGRATEGGPADAPGSRAVPSAGGDRE